MRLRILALASVVMSAPLVTAQTERITVRMAPSPNQTVRQHMTIAVAMTTDPDTLPAGAPAAAEQAFSMKTTMDVTSTVGPTDGRGTQWKASADTG